MSHDPTELEDSIDMERVLFDASYRRQVIDSLNRANPARAKPLAGARRSAVPGQAAGDPDPSPPAPSAPEAG